jgi:hypothetical protein
MRIGLFSWGLPEVSTALLKQLLVRRSLATWSGKPAIVSTSNDAKAQMIVGWSEPTTCNDDGLNTSHQMEK